MSLLFSLTLAREVSFGILQYLQYILHRITICIPFIFADSKNIKLVVTHDGFLSLQKIRYFEQLLIATVV